MIGEIKAKVSSSGASTASAPAPSATLVDKVLFILLWFTLVFESFSLQVITLLNCFVFLGSTCTDGSYTSGCYSNCLSVSSKPSLSLIYLSLEEELSGSCVDESLYIPLC